MPHVFGKFVSAILSRTTVLKLGSVCSQKESISKVKNLLWNVMCSYYPGWVLNLSYLHKTQNKKSFTFFISGTIQGQGQFLLVNQEYWKAKTNSTQKILILFGNGKDMTKCSMCMCMCVYRHIHSKLSICCIFQIYKCMLSQILTYLLW
jgi:hypothetical protein